MNRIQIRLQNSFRCLSLKRLFSVSGLMCFDSLCHFKNASVIIVGSVERSDFDHLLKVPSFYSKSALQSAPPPLRPTCSAHIFFSSRELGGEPGTLLEGWLRGGTGWLHRLEVILAPRPENSTYLPLPLLSFRSTLIPFSTSVFAYKNRSPQTLFYPFGTP